MKLLLTGGCGFIGSAVIRHAIGSTSHEILNIDKMTYAASEAALATIEWYLTHRSWWMPIRERKYRSQRLGEAA